MPEYRVRCVQVSQADGEIVVTARNIKEARKLGRKAIEDGNVDWSKHEYITDENIVGIEEVE